MNVNVNVKRKFKINGKEYNSIEEMPPDIRNAFEKAMASQAGSGQQANPATMQTKIIFNGTEYQSIDAMPQDVRQLYEKVLKAAETGTAPANIITAGDISDMLTGHKTYGNTNGEYGETDKDRTICFFSANVDYRRYADRINFYTLLSISGQMIVDWIKRYFSEEQVTEILYQF
jgi:hypothetical protein